LHALPLNHYEVASSSSGPVLTGEVLHALSLNHYEVGRPVPPGNALAEYQINTDSETFEASYFPTLRPEPATELNTWGDQDCDLHEAMQMLAQQMENIAFLDDEAAVPAPTPAPTPALTPAPTPTPTQEDLDMLARMAWMVGSDSEQGDNSDAESYGKAPYRA
jgi:hypothetical protein